MNRHVVLLLLQIVPALHCFSAAAGEPQPGAEITLAKDGRALTPVTTGQKASERVRTAADRLASYLSRISGARFEVETGDGASGIAVGLPDDFPTLPFKEKLAANDIAGREAYILSSHASGVYVIGATELAVEHAAWDLLHRLGYRQFFPGDAWEVIPARSDLKIAVHSEERPDYYTRRIWYGYGLWDYNQAPYNDWCAKNRATSDFVLSTGHAYQNLIRRNKAAFDANPEFYGLVNGERTSSKLCIGNPRLRALIVSYALKYFEEDPARDSISMDPSDGGGWCECERCAELGSISDRALTLANEVAAALDKRFKGKYVGMYAYNYHSPPPNIRVHPKVIISVANGFIRGGYTFDQLLDGWSKRGATLGVRDYYNVNVWSRDLPGRPRGSNLDYIRKVIPDSYRKGARFLSAESGDSWAPCGLGYYVASRILWDIDEADRVNEIVDDFLTRAFGAAKGPMKEFYDLIDGANRPRMSDDLLGRMYRLLDRAKGSTDAPKIEARINDLVLYTRYVELFREYGDAKGDARQSAFEDLIRHAYRMRKTMMIHTKALYRDLVNRDKNVAIPEGAAWNVPEDKNPWKSSEPFSEAEIKRYISEGVAKHKVAAIRPVEFSAELAPVSKLGLPKVKTGSVGNYGRGVQTFYTWIEQLPTTIELKVTGGLIAHYRDRGNAKIDLWKIDGEREEHVAHGETAPDGVERTIKLRAKHVGLHKITVSDGHDATKVVWEENTPMTVMSSLNSTANLYGRWSMYFYVPKGTKAIGVYASGGGKLLDSGGEVAFSFDGKRANFYSIPVPSGRDGGLWKFDASAGQRALLTVPPFLARNAEELLLPREVVERDAR